MVTGFEFGGVCLIVVVGVFIRQQEVNKVLRVQEEVMAQNNELIKVLTEEVALLKKLLNEGEGN